MKQRIYTTLLMLIFSTAVLAQEVTEQPLDTLTRHTAGLRQEIDVLKRIKLSGYIQAQFQVVDSAGAKGYAGGDFANGVDKRFMLRRARLKAQYDSPFNEKG